MDSQRCPTAAEHLGGAVVVGVDVDAVPVLGDAVVGDARAIQRALDVFDEPLVEPSTGRRRLGRDLARQAQDHETIMFRCTAHNDERFW